MSFNPDGMSSRDIRRLDFDRAREHAEEVVTEEQIDMDNFVELYSAATVAKDKKYVTEMERRFALGNSTDDKEMKRMAIVLEVIFNPLG